VHIERTVLKCKQDREVFTSMLRGIIVPLVSSFNEDFSLDLQSMRAHIQYLLSQGVNGIFVNASTSEFFSMSPDEQIQIMKLAAEELEDTSSALITGVTSNSTEHSVKLAKMAQEMNFDAVVAAPPYYGAFGEEALYQHFRAIAEGSRLPLILYDIPSATGNPLPPSLVEKLAKENLAAGIKVTRDSLTYLLDILAIKEKYLLFRYWWVLTIICHESTTRGRRRHCSRCKRNSISLSSTHESLRTRRHGSLRRVCQANCCFQHGIQPLQLICGSY